MKTGIFSDTHGHLERTILATRMLLDAGCEHLFHCGDLGSERVLIEIATLIDGRNIQVHAALGNVDLFVPSLLQFPENLGITVKRDHELELAGKRIAIVHGDDQQRMRSVIDSGHFDYLFTGHTHEPDDRMEGSTRVINPGAVYRAAEPGVATLDLETGELERMALA